MPQIHGTTEWLTKVESDDIPLLRRIAACPRVGAHVGRAFRLWRRGRAEVALSIPPGRERERWKPVTLAGEGLKLGGTAALGTAGKPVFKGQNIFTGGLKGDPMGSWDGSFDALAAPKFYLYGPLLDPSRLFAFRQIAQAATCLRVGGEAVFQNTVILVQLERDMPLDYWVLARPNQWWLLLGSGVVRPGPGSWAASTWCASKGGSS